METLDKGGYNDDVMNKLTARREEVSKLAVAIAEEKLKSVGIERDFIEFWLKDRRGENKATILNTFVSYASIGEYLEIVCNFTDASGEQVILKKKLPADEGSQIETSAVVENPHHHLAGDTGPQKIEWRDVRDLNPRPLA